MMQRKFDGANADVAGRPRAAGVGGCKGLIFASLLGAALNILAYGFDYGHENHPFELPMLNWLRDPSLYPGDAIRDGFSRFPTVFWNLIALLPHRWNIEAILFVFFLLTKVLFFFGLAWINRWATSDLRFARVAAVLIAVSPALNGRSPFGADHILAATQTHTPLAIALLVCAGAGLLERRWIVATFLAVAGLYFSAPYAIYMLFAFALFAVLDWPARRKSVVLAAGLGAALSAPWVILNRAHVTGRFPPDYIRALLSFYPENLRLSTHSPFVLLLGIAFLAVVLVVVAWAHLRSAAPDPRLELMALSFLAPVSMGAVAGEFFLTPRIANFELLRADSFLLFYSAVLLLVSVYRLADRGLIPLRAVVLPLAILAFAAPRDGLHTLLLVLGLQIALWREFWNCLGACRRWLGDRPLPVWIERGIQAGVGVVLIAVYGALIVLASHTWNPRARFSIYNWDQDPWLSLQTWARLNTAKDAFFLVPTDTEGFRAFSYRSSWGEWKDGTAIYLYPPFADIYLQRMSEVGWRTPPDLRIPNVLKHRYESQSWETLFTIARRNNLQFIVQYREVPYPVTPVYENSVFSVYRVPASP